jgi:hypothetical protein
MTAEITSSPHQFLAQKADAIRALARKSVFEIGKHLVEARDKCPHGKWLLLGTRAIGSSTGNTLSLRVQE